MQHFQSLQACVQYLMSFRVYFGKLPLLKRLFGFLSQEINRNVLEGTKASHDEDDRSFDMEHLQDGVCGLVCSSSTYVLIHADKQHHAGLFTFWDKVNNSETNILRTRSQEFLKVL